jgi:hypothetical protein
VTAALACGAPVQRRHGGERGERQVALRRRHAEGRRPSGGHAHVARRGSHDRAAGARERARGRSDQRDGTAHAALQPGAYADRAAARGRAAQRVWRLHC